MSKKNKKNWKIKQGHNVLGRLYYTGGLLHMAKDAGADQY